MIIIVLLLVVAAMVIVVVVVIVVIVVVIVVVLRSTKSLNPELSSAGLKVTRSSGARPGSSYPKGSF